MEIERYYTKGFENNVYSMFDWRNDVDVLIKNDKTGAVIFEAHNLEFPAHYSKSACDIIAKMYFRKSGVPETNHEVSMKQVAHRMINFWCMSAIDEKVITEEQADVFYDELMFMLLNQMWAPNSPQWFNTGLFHSYGIEGNSSGHYYWDENKNEVVPAPDGYTRSQSSACFIVNVNDSLMGKESLLDNLTTSTRLFKYGSGIGCNWSKIRGAGEALSDGGKSSGLMSFLKVFDTNAGTIKSGGVTRRAACMCILDDDHPDLLEFIRWKSREEDKVVALGKMGYDTSINGDAYETVSGQNVNNSISITDKFMESLETKDYKWKLRGRVDSSVDKELLSKDIWEEIGWASWRSGDPGVQFTDTINKWNTCPNSGRIESSNPCSEYLFLNNTSCNLASINILKFYNYNHLDLDGYLHAIKLIQIVLDATVNWGYYPTPEIAENTYKFRTTGLGITNLGALLMSLGIPYDSDHARYLGALLFSILTSQSYLTSTMMAKDVGCFSEYDKNKISMNEVIKNHQKACISSFYYNDEFGNIYENEYKKASDLWSEVIEQGEKYGYRNAQVSLQAPTGTISFSLDASSTGIEPFFSHIVYKKVIDGSYMKLVNPVIEDGLSTLKYPKSQIEDIKEYIEKTSKIEGAPHLKDEHLSVFDTASKNGDGIRFISPMGHVKMIAALTPHLSGAISKTVNCPSESTVEDIKNIYYQAWKLGCKCIALYRDGCKTVQPLTTKKEDVKSKDDINNLNYYELLEFTKSLLTKKLEIKSKRETLPAHPISEKDRVRMADITFHINRSFYDDGRLGELFVTIGKEGSTVKGLMEVMCILISKALQYGIPSEEISKIMRNHEFSPNGFVDEHPYIKNASSITDLISKFIDISSKNYQYCQVKPEKNTDKKNIENEIHHESPEIIGEERLYGKICSLCGSNKIMKSGHCFYCMNCGSTTGCS